MKTPYDLPEAKRWFEKASKEARAALKKVAAGDESALPKARRARDKMSDLLRWFYSDDRPYYDGANEEDDAIRALQAEAIDLGHAARQESRHREIRELKQLELERQSQMSPELRQYKKEIQITARDILRGVKR